MDPKHLGWRSTAQWLAEASAIFDGLSGFVVFGDTAGIVAAAASGNGRERWSAILDTVAGQLSRLCGVTILGDGIFYCRSARMISGPRIDLAVFAPGPPGLDFAR